MIELLPSRPLLINEVEDIDTSSTSTNVSAVSVLTPEEKPTEFHIYTLLIETDTRYLIGFNEQKEGWGQLPHPTSLTRGGFAR